MNTYEAYPHISEMAIAERTELLQYTCVKQLKCGDLSVNQLLSIVEDSLEKEQYELVAAIQGAVREFQENPQLSLL